MVARLAILLLEVAFFFTLPGDTAKRDPGTSLALSTSPQESEGQEVAEGKDSQSWQTSATQVGGALELAPRIVTHKGSFTEVVYHVELQVLQRANVLEYDQMHGLLLQLANLSMDKKEAFEIGIQEAKASRGSPKEQGWFQWTRTFEPLWKAIQEYWARGTTLGDFFANPSRSSCETRSKCRREGNQSTKDRECGASDQAHSVPDHRRSRWKGRCDRCSQGHSGNVGGDETSSASSLGQNYSRRWTGESCTHLSDRKPQEVSRQVGRQDSDSGQRMGIFAEEAEDETCRATSRIPGAERGTCFKSGCQKSQPRRSACRHEEKSEPGKGSSHQCRRLGRGRDGGCFALGCRLGEADTPRARWTNQCGKPQAQESKSGDKDSITVCEKRAPIFMAAPLQNGMCMSEQNGTCDFWGENEAGQNGTCNDFSRNLSIEWRLENAFNETLLETSQHSVGGSVSQSFFHNSPLKAFFGASPIWGHFMSRIQDCDRTSWLYSEIEIWTWSGRLLLDLFVDLGWETLNTKLALLTLLIAAAFVWLLWHAIRETFMRPTVRWKQKVFVCKRRRRVNGRFSFPRFRATSLFLGYLMMWEHCGVMAGNVLISTGEPHEPDSGSDDRGQDKRDAFPLTSRASGLYIFEMWMHKMAWMDAFIAYKQMMSMDLSQGHDRQLQTRWRGQEQWSDYHIVKVHTHASGVRTDGFSGNRFIAFPRGYPERTPIMVFLNGIERYMVGTVWTPHQNGWISLRILFDIIIPENQCHHMQLCSTGNEEIVFWPQSIWIEPGTFIFARQVDLHDAVEDGGGSATCTTTADTNRSDNDGRTATWSREMTSESLDAEEVNHAQGHSWEELHDLNTLFQQQFSAASFPSRIRENSQDLYQRMQRTDDEIRRQWEADRELANWNTRMTGTIQFEEEFDAFKLQRRMLTIFMYGLTTEYVGMESIVVNPEEVEDMLDIMVLIRRSWHERVPFLLMHVAYIEPQIPPFVLQGVDGISVLCDFDPHAQGNPIVILSITIFRNEDSTFDVSAHRANQMETCASLLHLTGFEFLCTFNAKCSCHHLSQQIDVIPVATFAGFRADLNVDFEQRWCDVPVEEEQGNHSGTGHGGGTQIEIDQDDQLTLMQTTAIRTPLAWMYGYPLNGRDTIRAWAGACGDNTPERFLATQMRVLRDDVFTDEIEAHSVHPQPQDMIDMNEMAYVVAVKAEKSPWQTLLLVDLVWSQNPAGTTGEAPAQETLWRAAKTVDFQLNLRTFYEQIGLAIFCIPDPSKCKTTIQGLAWEDLDHHLRLVDGAYALVKIQSALGSIPIGTQWDLAQNGCALEAMHDRLAPPTTTTTSYANRTLNRENSSFRNTSEDDEIGLMQRELRSETIFIYLENEDEPIVEELVEFELMNPIAALQRRYARRVPGNRPEHLNFFRVHTHPPDLHTMCSKAYLHALEGQIPHGRSLTMVDIEFFTNHRPRWRSARASPTDEWREIRTLGERMTRHNMLQELGLRTFCYGLDTMCLVWIRGALWNVQDLEPREIKDGDYVLVKVRRKDTQSTVQEQWRQTNGECLERPRHLYQQALLDYEDHRERRGQDDHHQVLDNVSFLQITRPSATKVATARLPPPGNGKKVTFREKVDLDDGTQEIDLTMGNSLLRDFCETRQDEEMSEMERSFFHSMRFENITSKKSQNPEQHDDNPMDERTFDLLHETQKTRQRDKVTTPAGLVLRHVVTQDENTISEMEEEMLQGTNLPIVQTEREIQANLPLVQEDGHPSPKRILLNDLVPKQPHRLILLDQLIPQGIPPQDCHSTAVKTNPRLDNYGGLHEHGVKFQCPGLSDLANVIVEQWAFDLQREIPYADFLAPGVFENIWWAFPQQTPFEQIRVYTDGSHIWNAQLGTKVAAWSFSVVGVDGDGQEWFLGFHARRVEIDEQSPNFLASTVEDSDHAETEAIIWAILWGMQSLFAQTQIPFVIISDARTKVHGFQGTWKMKDKGLGKIAHALVAAFQQITQCEFQWTRGHQGNTYNEVADHVAKMAALFPGEVGMPELAFIIPDFGNIILWLWCVFRSKFHSEFPRLYNDALLFEEPKPLQNLAILKQEATTPTTTARLKLHLLSYNVNTLGKAKSRGKMETIMQQIKALEANVVGLQETRRRQAKQFVKDPFLIFSSAASGGQGGIDLCFRTDKHFMIKDDKKFYFSAHDCTVVKAGPRLLVVRYKTEGWTALFVALHAPHEIAQMADKITFWTMVEDVLKPYRDLPCCVLMDANARVGSQYHQGIGTAFSQEENINGGFLARFVTSFEMFLPATFEKHILNPDEDQGTWYHKSGTTRLDYIALPLSWTDGTIHTDVTDCERAEDFKDHRMIIATVDVLVPTRESKKRSKTKVFSREEMKTPNAKNIIRASMLGYNDAFIPAVPRNANQHLDDLYAFVGRVMQENFVRASKIEKPTWIKSRTWENMVTLKSMRREVKNLQKMRKMAVLRQLFMSWKDSNAPTPSTTWNKEAHFKRAALELCVMKTAPFVRYQLANDETEYFTFLADAFAERCKEADSTEIWKAIRFVLPKFRARVKSKAINYTHTLESLEGHFAKIESARAVEPEELQKDLSVKAEQAIHNMKMIPRDLSELPTLLEFERALQRNKVGKSVFGEILPEWALACPREMAVQAFPLFMHLFIWAQQPAELKGGRYFPLWKGKQSQTSPTSYRAILINAVLAKAAHHVLRQRLVGPLRNILTGFQVGGLPGMSVTFAAHSLGLRREAAVCRGVSHAVIFCDFRSAFYSVRRSLLTDNCLGYDDYWDDEEMAIGAAVGPSPMEEAGVPVAIRAAVQEVLNASWYHVPLPGVETKSHWIPARGSRPGDPIADIAFTYLMARILRLVVEDTENEYPQVRTSNGTDLPLLPITWVDDTCFMLEDSQPERLLRRTEKVVQSLRKHSSANGLELNFDKGKSEILLRFQGKGALKAHRAFRSQGKAIHFEDNEGKQMKILSTSRYTHLGMVQTSSMNGDAELNHRLALAGEALKAIRMKVLRNEHISRKRRFDLTHAIVLSRLFYGSEVWTTISAKHLKKLDSFLYKVHKEILGFHSFQENERKSYLQLEAEYPFEDALTFIRQHRLRYFRKCRVEAPQILIEQIRQDDQMREGSWLAMVRDDFVWMKSHLDMPGAPGNSQDVDAWWDFAAADETRWKRWATRAGESEAALRQKRAQTSVAEGKDPSNLGPPMEETFPCLQCGMEFHGRAALTVHQYKIHHVLAPERAYIYNTTCGSCLRCYHSIQRVRQHLQLHQDCFAHLVDIWFPRDDVAIGEVDRTSSRNEHRLPFDLVHGPLLPTREE